MMNPKKLKQRIQKVQRVIGASRGKADNYNSALSHYSQYNSTMGNKNDMDLFRNPTMQLRGATQMARRRLDDQGNYWTQMEVRDHYVLLEPPTLSTQPTKRQKELKLWIGEVLHQVFSVSFNYFSTKVFDTQTMKIFCSESCIGNIINLSKYNQLTGQDLQLINLHLKKSLLPYFLLRYPQSNNKQVNQKLSREVSPTDYLSTNENNMLLKSKVRFQYRQNGIYYDQIMRFLNYIQEIPDRQLQNEKTMYDDFILRMEKLFTSVYSRKWTDTNLYDNYIAKNLPVQTLRNDVKLLQSQVFHTSAKTLIKQKNQEQKNYEQQVRQYTKYMINRKVSENVPLYTQQQINHGSIKILHPSVLRIIVKWCNELEQKFQSDYFIEKNEPFVMINGDEVQMIDQYRQKLSKYAEQEWKQIQKFLLSIQSNIYQKQSQLSFKNLMYYSNQKLTQYQQSLIKFANRNTEDVNHYAVCYLNRLIHGLMKLSKKMYDMYLNSWAEWPYPPTFMSFTISDLMRCKCFSKQKQIIRIYKQLQIQSEINPHIIKIVKVKNRLNKGTKDILLNVLMHQQILCQIQLAIKLQISDFSLYSDKFNHYVYQLQRSTYGPITEMCSIWSSNDERSQFIKDQRLRINQIQHKCSQQSLVPQLFPFTCSSCFVHYSQTRYIFQHQRCGACQKFWICGKCKINNMNQEKLINSLMQKEKNVQLLRRVLQKNFSKFPEYFIGFKLQSTKFISQRFRKFKINQQIMIAKYQNNKLKVIQLKKNNKQSIKKILQNFIFFQQKNPDAELSKLNIQIVLDQTTLNQIKQCYNKKSQSLRITKKNITKEILLKTNDTRAQSSITSLSFPENCIDTIQQVCLAFPNVKMLNLNKNKLKSMAGINNMKCLTDLYLGQNQFKEIEGLENLVDLKYVQLGDNIHSPVFKCSLDNLTKLQSLTIVRSNLKTFPEQVCSLPNLKLLWLFQNKIQQIPKSIGKLKNLQYLHMDMNLLRQLPQQIYTLKKLTKLMLSFNQIQQISDQIQNLQNLQILTLQNNPLKKVPQKNLKCLKQLQMVTLNKNLQKTLLSKIFGAAVFK